MSCLDRGLLEALLMSHSVYKPQLERFLTSYINNWRWAIMGILKGSRERNWRKCRCLCMARNELAMFVVLLGSQMKAPWEVWLWAHSKIWCNRRPHPWSHKHGYTWRKMAVREGSTLGSLFIVTFSSFLGEFQSMGGLFLCANIKQSGRGQSFFIEEDML